MSTSTLEKPQEIKSFTSLIHLREQLTKEAKNQERLTEFQKTIDEAIKDGDKRGVIEFTEKEWKTLITNENLPPFEEVQTLLKEKIKSRKEVTREAKEKTGGIMGELQNKTDEAKKALEEVKGKAQGAIKEALSPIQKTKENITKLGNSISETWSNIWTPVKFAWYTLWATLGFKFGRDALASMTKEKAEKVVEEAKKKAGKLAGKGEEMIKEGKEGLIEKVGPLAALSTAGVGIFALLKDRLPPSIASKLEGEKGVGLLKKLATNRALRLFGVGGVALFGIGKLFNYLEDPKKLAELGECPSDVEGKKVWWKGAIEKAGMDVKDGAYEVLQIVNGEKLDEYLTKKENEQIENEEYCALKDHPIVQEAGKELRMWENDFLTLMKDKGEGFIAAGVVANFLTKGALLNTGLKGSELFYDFLRKGPLSHALLFAIAISLGLNSIDGIKHIRVKKNITTEELKETITDILTIKDFREYIKDKFPDSFDEQYIDPAVAEMSKLGNTIKSWRENWKSKLESGLINSLDALHLTQQEKINHTNASGLTIFQAGIKNIAEEKKDQIKAPYQKLLGVNGHAGIIQSLISKLEKGNQLSESDIRSIMEGAEGTDILISPEGESREKGRTIQYTIKNDTAKNLCVNPCAEFSTQYCEAQDFVVDPLETGLMNLGLTWAKKMSEGGREWIGELAHSVKEGKGEIAQFGVNTFFYDYVYKKFIKLPIDFLRIPLGEDWGGLSTQEFLVEHGQSFVPMMILGSGLQMGSSLIDGRLPHFGKILCNTVIAPIHGARGSALVGQMIYNRAMAGRYADIFRDPAIIIKDTVISKLQKLGGGILRGTILLRNQGHHMRDLGKIREIKSKIREYKIYSELKMTNETRANDISKRIGELINKDSAEDLRSILGWPENVTWKRENMDLLSEKIDNYFSTLNQQVRKIVTEDPDRLQNRPDSIEKLKMQDINTPEGKKAAEEALEDSKKEIEVMEKKRIQAEKDLLEAKKAHEAKPSDAQLKQEYEARRQGHSAMMTNYHENHRGLSEIREAMGEVLHGRKPRIKLGESHLRSIKGLRGSVKVLGILAATVGAGFGIEKIAEYIHGDSHENRGMGESTSEDDEKYFGFRKNNAQSATEQKEKSSDTCETPEEFNKRIEMIETQYTESTSKFLDPEWVQKISSEEREKIIQEAADGHMLRVDAIKSLIRANKGMMEGFWNKQFTNEETGEEIIPNDIREQGVKAFMFIHKKGGKLTLDYMSHQDMKNVLYLLYDQNYKTWVEKNLGSGVATAGDLTLRVAPFTGSFMDGKDAYGSFSRGNIGDGLWSTAWCIGGLIMDVGGVVSLGGTTAAGSALRAGKVAKTAGRALLHNGVQFGVQFGTSLAKVPRSESIKIDDL